MSDSRSDLLTNRDASAAAQEPDQGRKPFSTPTVEDLGGLTDLTLIGGSL